MSLTRLSSIVLYSAFIVLAGTMAAQQPHISFADQPRMLDCNPVSAVPCFAASFNIVDDRGQQVGVDLGSNLVPRVKMTSESTQVQVFYAAAAAQARHGRITMILVDISGSMARKLPTGETRYQAARSALAQFLYDFRDGVDQVAIVPFESHNVISTIQGAAFAQTRDEAERQVSSMPVPRPQNNTALFSAVIAGLDALSSQRKTQASDVDTLLVVMTDGTNDIRPGDDPGLLADSFGLEQAHNRVALSGIQVNAIGFGDPAAIDQAALRQISTRPPIMAVSADNLNQAINQTRKLFTDKVQVAFLTSWTDAASLAGKNVVFRASLDLVDGRRLTSDDGRFETPQIGSPLPSGKAGPELLQALAHFGSPVAAQPGLLELLRPIFVFLG